jgi:hypothetical protein
MLGTSTGNIRVAIVRLWFVLVFSLDVAILPLDVAVFSLDVAIFSLDVAILPLDVAVFSLDVAIFSLDVARRLIDVPNAPHSILFVVSERDTKNRIAVRSKLIVKGIMFVLGLKDDSGGGRHVAHERDKGRGVA